MSLIAKEFKVFLFRMTKVDVLPIHVIAHVSKASAVLARNTGQRLEEERAINEAEEEEEISDAEY